MKEENYSEDKAPKTELKNYNNEPNMMIPAAIIIAGIFISIAIFGSRSPVGNQAANQGDIDQPALPSPSVEDAILAAGANPEEIITCAENGTFDDDVAADIDNMVATGGQGTPWTIVFDTETNSYYPLNGAFPLDQLQQILDSDFQGVELTVEQTEALARVAPVSESDHYRGSANARYIFIEYSDFDCPFCSQFHSSMKTLIANNNNVGWVYRHFPLESIHPNARAVANVSECIGDKGGSEAFWNFADAYFGV